MGELVPTHSHDLIFQPTESLAAKVINEQQRSDELRDEVEFVRRRFNRSRLWSFSFGGIAFMAALTTAVVALVANAEIDDADSDKDKAESLLAAERLVTERQRNDLNSLREYERLAQDYDKVKNVHLFTIDHYRSELEGRGDLPPKVQEALKYDPEIRIRLGKIQQELLQDQQELQGKVNVVENYIATRLSTPIPGPTCYPHVIFESSGTKCEKVGG